MNWRESFRRTRFYQRILIGIIFVLSLSLFLHLREKQIDILEPGSIADHYSIAQVDFEFPDDEATANLRQESIKDIGSLYKIDSKQLHLTAQTFEKELSENSAWRHRFPSTTSKEMHKGAKAVERALDRVRFTDLRTLKLVRSIPSYDFVEKESDSFQQVSLPNEIWEGIKKMLINTGRIDQDTAVFVIAPFREERWTLEADRSLERDLREQVSRSIPEVYTKVHAGTHLIDAGDRVTPRQVAMQIAMQHAQGQTKNLWAPLTIIGSAMLSLMFTVLAFIYLRMKHRVLLNSIPKLTLLITIVIFTLLISKVVEYIIVDHTNASIDVVRYPLFIPFASLLVGMLVGSQIALFTSGFLAITLGVSLAIDYDRFLVINLIAAFVIILSAKQIHRRKDVFLVCGKAWLGCVPIIFAFSLGENVLWNPSLLTDLFSTFVFMAATALLVVGLLPVLESIFKVMTDMTLMEYMDPNNPLLRRLSIEAPGTYQHCLVLGHLAEAAANAIRANGLFCRVSTLYHDVGKLSNPHYFTENQLGGFNIHPLLTPLESAALNMKHVPERETLARKHRLPQSFIDIIREHHGTTLIYYFYHKQLELMGNDPSKVDQKPFRYAGPKPSTKESAIIMIADTVEACSRSLEEVTEEGLTQMVDKLVTEKADDGQFDECPLSFEELGIIKRTIVKTLIVARHLRVKYPSKPSS